MSYKYLTKINSPVDLRKINKKELPSVAQELREKIIEVVSNNGGHLATSLGSVDLILALHYAFNSPIDKIVWDVGHQCYAHKLLTGRFDKFETLRQYKGLSGFPNKYESEYDIFTTGHSSTAISQALGLAVARDLKKEKNKVVAVVGDGSLSGGMSFEALNNAGQLKTDLIVVLNDNEMAISKNVGALSEYLARIITTPIYKKVRDELRTLIKKLPVSVRGRVLYTTEKVEESLKGLLVPGMLFEELGFFYVGPIDGHNTAHLIDTFESVKKFDAPVFIHVITKKGKGYKPAEEQPMPFHGTGPFNIVDGSPKGSKSKKSYTDCFSETVVKLAEKEKKVLGITAAMTSGVGLLEFSKKYPDRFFDVGIAECHAVAFAGALAVSGYKPITAIYSTFLQRAYDQIIHDVCLQNAPLILAIDRTGLVGEDGATHHGVFTIPYLRHIPNLTMVFPKDGKEFGEMFKFAVKYTSPIAVCYPRGSICDEKFSGFEFTEIEAGKSEVLIKGQDIAIFALGSMVEQGLDAVNQLKEQGISASLINVRFVKPFDEKLLLDIIKTTKNIMVIEEGAIAGGLGSLIMECLEVNKIRSVNIKCLGIPDSFIEHGKRDFLLEKLGLSSSNIVKEAMNLVSR